MKQLKNEENEKKVSKKKEVKEKKVTNEKTLGRSVKRKLGKVKRKVKKIVKNDFDFSNYVIICITAVLFTLFGIVIGYLLNYGKNTMTGKPIGKNLQNFITTYEDLKNGYMGDFNEKKVLDEATKAMINALDDPYTTYMNEENADNFNEEIKGSYVGIGVTVNHGEGRNEIIEVAPGYAADKAGMKVGDIIIAVDDMDVTNIFGDELSKYIRGKEGTKVKVTVKRGENTLDIDLKRVVVDVVSVESYSIAENGKKVGVITISNFASNTYKQFEKELLSLEKEKIDSLVIDVRNNLGGQLNQVKNILNLFFDKKTVLFKIKDHDKVTRITGLDDTTRKYPVAVVVNNSSASASEVLAACFNDNYKKAYIVGNQTFGKGTVQKTKTLSGGSKIKYTTQQWLTPKGEWLDGDGLTPKYKVDNPDDFYKNPCYENDLQLKKAIELVSK